MIIPCTSQTELDSPDQRVGISAAALVNRLMVRTVSVTVRIIAIGIVPVVWIGIVKERVPEIAKEDEPIVEVAMVEPIAAKATITKATATKLTATKATAVKATAKPPPLKPALPKAPPLKPP